MTKPTRNYCKTYKGRKKQALELFLDDELNRAERSFPASQRPVTRIAFCKCLGIAQGTSYCGPWPRIFADLKRRGIVQ